MDINKKLIVSSSVAVVLLILILFGGDFLGGLFETRTILTPPPDLKVDTYSLGGKVLKVEGDKILFEAGAVFVTDKGENVFDFVKKTALTSSDTKIHKSGDPDSPVPSADIKPDSEITVYTSQNPFKSDEFPAERIEVK